MKVNGHKVRKMGQDFIYLPMEIYMKDSLKMEIDKVKEAILGLIKVITRVSG